MVDLSSWCILCGKDSPDGIAIKILPKTLMTTIYGFAKNVSFAGFALNLKLLFVMTILSHSCCRDIPPKVHQREFA